MRFLSVVMGQRFSSLPSDFGIFNPVINRFLKRRNRVLAVHKIQRIGRCGPVHYPLAVLQHLD